MIQTLRRFEERFPKKEIPNFPGLYLESVKLSCAGEYPQKRIYITLDSYQIITGQKQSVLESRIAEYIIPYRWIDGDLFLEYEVIKTWLQIDKKPYDYLQNKEKRRLLEGYLSKLCFQPSIWFRGIEDNLSEEDLEEEIECSIYEDPGEQLRCDLAELERFQMLGF